MTDPAKSQPSQPSQPIQVELSRDEALVLFELPARFEEASELKLKSNAEFIAVSAIATRLQSVLVEPFDPDYKNIVAEASARLEVGYEGLAPGVER